jgi:glyoxylase I family protein
MIRKIHHIAIICSDYVRTKKFYTEILGLEIKKEIFREQRQSWKLDLALGGEYIIEVFSFPNPPKRPSFPEAAGLRHLAFAVDNIDEAVKNLKEKGISCETTRTDEITGKRFTFFADPDNLPIEFYEI